MYTEEDEFNYDDYLDENEESNQKKPLIDWRFILKIILVILLVILIIFLVFKIKNKNVSKSNNKNNNTIQDVSYVFDNNMELITNIARDYFFNKGNLPKNEGESISITVKKMIDEKLITKVVDAKGNTCGYNTSNATLTKNKNDYKLEVTLICLDNRDTKVYYFDNDGKCLNCNGEIYPLEETVIEEPTIEEPENNDNNIDIVDDTDKVPSLIPESPKACSEFSPWSTIYVSGNNYERQTRTLVRGYKSEVVYGEWSEPSTTKIESNDNLEVKTYTESNKVTTKTAWSSESTTKPNSKSGREISSRTETVQSSKKVCTQDKEVTKILTKWDNSAYKCKTLSLGKVECTYIEKGSCSYVPTTKQVTFYKYRDTVTKNVTTTYYQSRTITNNVTYTDYMLESELPYGYAKVVGSERVEYRYREKCSK